MVCSFFDNLMLIDFVCVILFLGPSPYLRWIVLDQLQLLQAVGNFWFSIFQVSWLQVKLSHMWCFLESRVVPFILSDYISPQFFVLWLPQYITQKLADTRPICGTDDCCANFDLFHSSSVISISVKLVPMLAETSSCKWICFAWSNPRCRKCQLLLLRGMIQSRVTSFPPQLEAKMVNLNG